MSQDKTKELKPCPFCGTEVGIFYCGTGTYEVYSIDDGCLICGDGILIDHGGIVSADINVVVDAWNKRVSADCEGCRQLKEELKATREASWEVQRQNRELKEQLTEAQGKRGKVVSVEEIANLIMFGFNSQPWSLVSTFENSGEVVNIATAIFKAVYGEGER
jgi:hypothetical protein